MDTTPKYILMCEKTREIQEVMHKLGSNYLSIADWRFQGYCTKHKCLLTEGYDGDTDCLGWQKIKDAPHKGGWNIKEDERRYREDDCRRSPDKFWIALPRQDQLQEMLEETLMGKRLRESNRFSWAYRAHPKGWMTTCILWEFSQWEDKVKGYQLFDSWEQLWLAFVMKEKYDKVWSTTKKDWVHEKN